MTDGEQLKAAVRDVLFRLGRRVGEVSMYRLNVVHSYLEMGSWSATLGDSPTEHHHRNELFALAAEKIASAAQPLYLEFGVFEGESLRWWSEHLDSANARLIGFDSFEGLPESWNRFHDKGAFDVSGPPQIDDDRIGYEVGWFDDTVPCFDVPEHDALIVNIDSDLYSSAALVLNRLALHLRPGTLIYFDEFSDRDHELRAFRDFLNRSGKSVRALGTADRRNQWLFEVVSD